MKTLRLFGMALMAVLMCVNFTSCSSDDENNVIPEKDSEYITIGINCSGEFLTLRESPMNTRADESVQGQDVYAIKVYEVGENNTETGYAYGVFTSLDNVKIKLLAGKKYNFRAVIQVGNNDFGKTPSTEFTYSTSIFLQNFETIQYGGREPFNYDRYYGEATNYVAEQNSTINIETKRTAYGVKIIANGLTEGTLNFSINNVTSSSNMRELYSIEMTTEIKEVNNIYAFQETRKAWQQYEDYTVTKKLYITWTKNDNSVTPLGTYDVAFKRNVRTTIRINLENFGLTNGLEISKEENEMTNDENEYVIENGVITETKVTQG